MYIRGVHFHDTKVKCYLGALHSRARKLNISLKIAKLRLLVIFMFLILQVKKDIVSMINCQRILIYTSVYFDSSSHFFQVAALIFRILKFYLLILPFK